MKYTVVEIKNLNVWVKHTLNKTEEKLVNRNIVENYPECRPPPKNPKEIENVKDKTHGRFSKEV